MSSMPSTIYYHSLSYFEFPFYSIPSPSFAPYLTIYICIHLRRWNNITLGSSAQVSPLLMLPKPRDHSWQHKRYNQHIHTAEFTSHTLLVSFTPTPMVHQVQSWELRRDFRGLGDHIVLRLFNAYLLDPGLEALVLQVSKILHIEDG